MSNLFGLELEYEGVSVDNAYRLLKRVKNKHWAVHQDGSLRPRDLSCELVFRTPLNTDDSLEACSTLHSIISSVNDQYKTIPEHPSRVGDGALMYFHTNWRTAMHLHVDARMEKPGFYTAMLILSSLLDPLIFSWDGTNRHESKYCRPIMQSIIEHCNTMYARPSLNTKSWVFPELLHDRYMSVNFASLERHGSVEYRQPQSTTSIPKIVQFLSIVGSIAEAAREHSHDLWGLWSIIETSRDARTLASRVLGSQHKLLSGTELCVFDTSQLIAIYNVIHCNTPATGK